ncbi:MAG TPA: EthD domain-containing protein [Acidimicrobiales bacterium]|nr:EthD domain-containing protein [Acidimicrobiales bacterium]
MTAAAVVLLAPGTGGGLAPASAEELAHLRRALGDGAVAGFDRTVDAPDLVEADRGAPWEVAFELHGPADGVVAAVRGMAQRLGPAVDPAASLVVVGDDRTIFEKDPGPAPVKLFYALFPRPDVTPAAFRRHWEHVHARFVDDSPYVRHYHQLHADGTATAEAAAAAGFGSPDVVGAAVEVFESEAAFLAAGTAEGMDEEFEDILSVTDGTRNRGILTRERQRA